MSSKSEILYLNICNILEDKHSNFTKDVKAIQSQHPEVRLAFTPSNRNRPASIDSIIVDKEKRGQGVASKFMNKMTKAADQHGVKLSLSPSNAYGSSVVRLKKFYKTFGFKQNSGTNQDPSTKNSFIREPVSYK